MQIARLSLILTLVSFAALAQALEPVGSVAALDPQMSAQAKTSALLSGSLFFRDPDGCPFPNIFASAQDIFEQRFQALVDGDMQALACFYAPDVTVILPGSVVRGRAAVVQAFSEFGAIFGGAQPELTSVTADHFVVLATFSMIGETLSVPDGADTYVIVGGRIIYQTVHSTIVPTAAP
ncbi:MAG TPA: nuclear transport factor 2 family protein [Myxococcaceae bacterium]|nr:nuclear transport factor 2 family protein [Myxococcaceae bacterium]